VADDISEGQSGGIAFAFGHPDEMMALYQAVMNYKFDIDREDAETVAVDPSLGAVADRLVDALIIQARSEGDETMALAMHQWRDVSEGYRQLELFRRLRSRLDWWAGAGRDRRLGFIQAFFRPLRVPAELAAALAGEG